MRVHIPISNTIHTRNKALLKTSIALNKAINNIWNLWKKIYGWSSKSKTVDMEGSIETVKVHQNMDEIANFLTIILNSSASRQNYLFGQWWRETDS